MPTASYHVTLPPTTPRALSRINQPPNDANNPVSCNWAPPNKGNSLVSHNPTHKQPQNFFPGTFPSTFLALLITAQKLANPCCQWVRALVCLLTTRWTEELHHSAQNLMEDMWCQQHLGLWPPTTQLLWASCEATWMGSWGVVYTKYIAID